MSKVKCFLRCIGASHPDIPLPHGSEVVLGRGKVTKIKDSRCSREQVKLVSDCEAYTVNITQVGINSTSVGGGVVGVGKMVVARHKTQVEILSGQFEHQVLFNPPPSEKELGRSGGKETMVREEEENKKRKASNEEVVKVVKKQKVFNNGAHDVPWFDSSEGKILKEEKDGIEWREVGEGKMLVRFDRKVEAQEKIAAFDIDGTLITTMSGKVFPTDINDWKILHSEVPGKLKKLIAEGYKLVFITNQAGIAKGKMSVEQFQTKIANILGRLGVPAMVFVSVSDKGFYRKPRPGIWEWLELRGNKGVRVDRENSFYCGDAAGRPADHLPGRKKDFSCSDRLLAANLGLKFLTPEEMFLNHKPSNKFNTPFHPKDLPRTSLYDPPDSKLVLPTQFLALLVGIQGSGKSKVARDMEEKGVVVASNDRTGGKEKTLRLVEQSLSQGKSVVVDNTHVDREARKPYISLGVKFGVVVRGLMMTTSHDHARHNNLFRELTDPEHTRIKEPLFNQYRSKFSPPVLEEGFNEIIKVHCVPSFPNQDLETLYLMYLLEK